jgi:phosphatidylglycerophosphate synthase
MISLKHLADVLSLSRILWGTLTAICMCSGLWGWTLTYYLIGHATDASDGPAARKFNPDNPHGEMTDDIGDTALSAGAWLGSILSDLISWITGLIIAGIFIVLASCILFLPPTHRLYRLCYGLALFYNLGLVSVFLATIAYLAMGMQSLWLLPVATALIYFLFKSNREKLRRSWGMIFS